MKRSAGSKNRWADHYTRQAKKDRYPARSVYKLQEIQKKHRVIKKGHHVLDLGCSPGSWLLYAAELTGPKGKVVGIDLKPVTIKVPEHVTVISGDIYDFPGELETHAGKGFNAVISDMAPATTGNRAVDAARSLSLCEAALDVAEKNLLPGGAFVCKIFQGEDFKSFTDRVKKGFDRQVVFKPQSSRKASREIFVIGKNKR